MMVKAAGLVLSMPLLMSFQKLDPKYLVSYGDSTAPIHVVEYYSLSCHNCCQLFKKDFHIIKEKYINPGLIYWSFHPDPADLLTLQVMACFETMSLNDKCTFFEHIVSQVELGAALFNLQLLMQTMILLRRPIPPIETVDTLKKTPAFEAAYQFLKQPDVITSIPTVEINGKIYEEYPSRQFIESTLRSLTVQEKQP